MLKLKCQDIKQNSKIICLYDRLHTHTFCADNKSFCVCYIHTIFNIHVIFSGQVVFIKKYHFFYFEIPYSRLAKRKKLFCRREILQIP